MNDLSGNIVKLSDIRTKKLGASSPYGPLRAGLITYRTTRDRQLLELLSDLEKKVNDLTSKSYEVLGISIIATEAARAALSAGGTSENGTDLVC
jgi:hypothetical protein